MRSLSVAVLIPFAGRDFVQVVVAFTPAHRRLSEAALFPHRRDLANLLNAPVRILQRNH
jgi:hypothetical protein